MAQASLLVLQVTLSFWEGDAHVELTPIRPGGALEAGERTWRFPAASIGVPNSIGPDTEPVLNLPPQVAEGLRANLAGEPDTVPLWLRFAKPHGYLAVLPWERELGKALARPVLRLPDLLERPHENRDVLEVAVCFLVAPDTEEDKAVEQFTRLIEAISRGSPRFQTRVNVFTTPRWIERLRATKSARSVHFADPSSARTSASVVKRASAENEPPPLGSPWSVWISETLGHRSLDAIHFVCPSDLSDAGPALVMLSSPSPEEKAPLLSFVDAGEVATLMTRTGAWAALFSPPPDGTSGAMAALMADSLAHTRPGAVLYQKLLTPEHTTDLRRAYQFLFSPSPAAAPALRDGFLYCQPAAVAAHAGFEVPSVLAAIGQNAALLERAAPLAERVLAAVTAYIPGVATHQIAQPPSWASAVQRHIETVALEELRRSSSDVLLSTPEGAQAQVDPNARQAPISGVAETLADIQNVVGEYLRKA